VNTLARPYPTWPEPPGRPGSGGTEQSLLPAVWSECASLGAQPKPAPEYRPHQCLRARL